MAWVEFEEKEMEEPLDLQLVHQGLLWPPGQVLENVVGFDAALAVHASAFWTILGYPAPLPGAVILQSWWTNASPAAWVKPHPPSWKLNAFLQYKRPEYLHGAMAEERCRWPTGLYYRFGVDTEQQLALEACASALAGNGLFLYVTPAFYDRDVLYDHIEKHTLVENVHFVKAVDLKGHGRFTYADAALPGQAHSRPVDVVPHVFAHPRDRPAPRQNATASQTDDPLLGDLRLGRNGGDGGEPPGPLPPDGSDGGRGAEILTDARLAAEAAVRASVVSSASDVGSSLPRPGSVDWANRACLQSLIS